MPARPGGSNETRVVNCECRVCHSHRCEQVAPMSAPWLCRTLQRVPLTARAQEVPISQSIDQYSNQWIQQSINQSNQSSNQSI